MTRALFRKQMMEVFSWLYKDRKSGKLRTARGIAGYALMYLIIFGFIGVIFGIAAAALCGPLLSAGMGWLYWCLMGVIAVFFGVFGSVFNTYSSLYQARDNDLLLSMPVPTSRILMVRLSGVYAMGLMYEMIAMIPTLIIWFVTAPFSVLGTINALLIPIVLSFFILVLSTVLGWVVALIVGRIKHRNIIIVFISLIFMAAYYYVYSKAYSILQIILLNADAAGSRLRIPLYPLYHMGMAAQGSVSSMLIFTAIVAALSVATYAVLSKSFLKLATSNRGTAKTVYKEQTVKAGSAGRALLRKEFKRFTGSANYMLNCGLGIILMPVSAVVLIWKADMIQALISRAFIQDYVPALAVAAVCALAAMNDMAAPSVSLEGKSIWITQSLPVSGRQVLTAKLKMHLILTLIPAVPLVIAVEWVMKPTLFYAVMIPAVVALFVVLMAEIGLMLNLKMPNLHWSSEVVPIKQSAAVMIALFGGWGIVVVIAGLYVLAGTAFDTALSADICFIVICVLLAAACIILMRWLMCKGARIFESLQ